MIDAEVFELIANKTKLERTVRCTDVTHPRHLQVGRLLSATLATNSGDAGCLCSVGFANDPTNAGSAIPVRIEGLVAEFLNAQQIEFQI